MIEIKYTGDEELIVDGVISRHVDASTTLCYL